MTRSWGSCLLLLTILVALVASTDPGKNKVKVLRELKVINASNANVKQCLWFAMQEYNKESEDKYLFQVVKTVQVQLQVKVSFGYFIDVEIGRSNCRKFQTVLKTVPFKRTLNWKRWKVMCSFLIGALPWNGEFMVIKKQCADA
uniref:Cystatin 8 n=1 Tax=Ursus americanus TaxID=9643 RepID=A0A452R605_URSAM